MATSEKWALDRQDECGSTPVAVERLQTARSVSIPPELFEKLYLSPQNAVKGELRKTFANPTPVALAGFLLALTPLCCILLGWRGATGLGASNIGAYFYFGGMLLLLGGVGEFILGNSFPTVVFTTFGSFWFTFGATLTPSYGAYAAYSDDPTNAPQHGLTSPEFMNSFGFFLLFMGLLCAIFCVASVRTNIVFFFIFFLLVPAFGCLSGSFWQTAQGNAQLGLRLQHVGAGLAFVICLLGWYIFLALVLAGVDYPVSLPLGDLSTLVKGAIEKAKLKAERESKC